MSQFDINGRLITLKYKGGEVKVLFPPDVSVMKRIVTDHSALRTGADVSVQGARSRGSALTSGDSDCHFRRGSVDAADKLVKTAPI